MIRMQPHVVVIKRLNTSVWVGGWLAWGRGGVLKKMG